ncbi:MAG: hypothetical protein GW808_07180 [Sphingomonadales bacterium]|nr:hypothetical protein [Sphingomonadales bacterium]PIX64264.1 MAG: hypothetical protein COZ43_12295 [Sphingomonadales bacterium CG_4_10_14_3_um_filter_58_15]NCO47841.1 hypothetical protein [Sphingomonadales bacterium]NCP00725.1 hypothetical protein [Sphingomonadales bacterium]NCP27454.1 hypothetical protein [Sphingomonadales bacterium]
MEGAVILKAIGLLGFGFLFVWFGFTGWIHRREERISLVEAALLKMSDEAPLPHNRWDRAMAYVQPILCLIFGPIMIFLGLILLFV